MQNAIDCYKYIHRIYFPLKLYRYIQIEKYYILTLYIIIEFICNGSLYIVAIGIKLEKGR